MKNYIKAYLRNFDYPLFITYAILVIFGLIMVYSASMVVAVQKEGMSADHYFNNQIINIVVSLCMFFAASFFPYKNYKKPGLMKMLFWVMVILIGWLWLFGFGKDTTGSQSWISIFGLTTFQPSEYAKLFLILYMSGTIYNKSLNKNSIRDVSPIDITFPIIIWIGITFSIAMETDLGAVIIVGFIAASIFVLSGVSWKLLLKYGAIIGGFGALVLGFVALIKDDNLLNISRMGRIKVLGNPFEYASDLGYQLVNGYLAIGAGGLKGVGLGQSIQKLGYLPEPQTDFIMAIIAEELGIKGVAIVIIGLGFIVCRALIIAMKTKDPLARMIAGAIGSWIGFQAFVNLGGISGVIPLTGVTLPFISYGGSSIMLLSFALGILMNISMFYKRETRK